MSNFNSNINNNISGEININLLSSKKKDDKVDTTPVESREEASLDLQPDAISGRYLVNKKSYTDNEKEITGNNNNTPATPPRKPFEKQPGKVKSEDLAPGIKSLSELTPSITLEELSMSGRELTKNIITIENGNEVPKTILTPTGEELIDRAVKNLRGNAVIIQDDIKDAVIEVGLASPETIQERTKRSQSLTDKIRTYLIENPNDTFDEAIRSVRDAYAVRTVNGLINGATHPRLKTQAGNSKVREYLKKGDIKSAINAAVESESTQIFDSLIKLIDQMADGTAKIYLTRISNYVGEDGIPYFTESQLNRLQVYAAKKGIELPVESRVINITERSNPDEIHNSKSTTKISKSGYPALQMNFMTIEGDIFEWQYRGYLVNNFAEAEHIPYDLRTGKDIIGKDAILEPLYEPIKEMLSEENMSKDTFKEYNAYLTAHYKYLRIMELGLPIDNPKPVLPEGIPNELSAENLEVLHNIADKLKKGEISQEDALIEYQEKIAQSSKETTTESYRKKLDKIAENPSIDRYEANVRLDTHTKEKRVQDSTYLRKACSEEITYVGHDGKTMQRTGEIKENLVHLAEIMQSKGIDDIIIANFIRKIKKDGDYDKNILTLIDKLITPKTPQKNKATVLQLIQTALSTEKRLHAETMTFIESLEQTNSNEFLNKLIKFIEKNKNDDGSIKPEAIEYFSKAKNKLENSNWGGLEVVLAMGENFNDAEFNEVTDNILLYDIRDGQSIDLARKLVKSTSSDPTSMDMFFELMAFSTNHCNLELEETTLLLSTCTDNNGNFNQYAAETYKEFVQQFNAKNQNILKLIHFMKGNDGIIKPELKELIEDMLIDLESKNINIDTEFSTIEELMKSLKGRKGKDADGKTIWDLDNDKIALAKELYNTIPDQGETINKRIENVNNLLNAMIFDTPKGTVIDPKLKDAILELYKINVETSSIRQLSKLILKKTSTHELKEDRFNWIMGHYNSLPTEDKSNIESIILNPETVVLKMQLTLKGQNPDENNRIVTIDIPYIASSTEETTGKYNTDTRSIHDDSTDSTTIIKKQRDSVRNVSTKVLVKDNVITTETRVYKDPVTGEQMSEQISQTGINGILDVRIKDSHGNTKVLSTAYIDDEGTKVAEQDFTSLDGTRTQYKEKELTNGNRYSTYVITDVDGNELLNIQRSFEQIDDTHYVSTLNGHKYTMSIDEDRILSVRNEKREEIKFDLDSFTQGEYLTFKEILSNIPGDEWFNITKTNLVSITSYNQQNACYRPLTNDINMGDGHTTLTTFFHEFGHNKDYKIEDNKTIREDKIFYKIFNEERAYFITAFPDIQRKFIRYFISHAEDREGRPDRPLREVVAESNSILNSSSEEVPMLEFRKLYLERYFPKTIAYLAKKLNPDL